MQLSAHMSLPSFLMVDCERFLNHVTRVLLICVLIFFCVAKVAENRMFHRFVTLSLSFSTRKSTWMSVSANVTILWMHHVNVCWNEITKQVMKQQSIGCTFVSRSFSSSPRSFAPFLSSLLIAHHQDNLHNSNIYVLTHLWVLWLLFQLEFAICDNVNVCTYSMLCAHERTASDTLKQQNDCKGKKDKSQLD